MCVFRLKCWSCACVYTWLQFDIPIRFEYSGRQRQTGCNLKKQMWIEKTQAYSENISLTLLAQHSGNTLQIHNATKYKSGLRQPETLTLVKMCIYRRDIIQQSQKLSNPENTWSLNPEKCLWGWPSEHCWSFKYLVYCLSRFCQSHNVPNTGKQSVKSHRAGPQKMFWNNFFSNPSVI